MEIGNNKENLILKTAGKVKIQWGNKFIDLLDRNGNLSIKSKNILNSINSKESISKDGIYMLGNSIIFKMGNNQVEIQGSSEESNELDDISELRNTILELQENIEEQSDQIVDIQNFLTQAFPVMYEETEGEKLYYGFKANNFFDEEAVEISEENPKEIKYPIITE